MSKLCSSLDEKLTDAEKKANVKLLQTQERKVFVAGLNRELEIVEKALNPKSLEEAISLADMDGDEIILCDMMGAEISKQIFPHHVHLRFRSFFFIF